MRDPAAAYAIIEERLGLDLKSADPAAELATLGVDSLTLLELLVYLTPHADVPGVLIVGFAAPSDLADGIFYLGKFPR